MTQSSTDSNAHISLLSKLVIQGYSGDYSAPRAHLDHLHPELEEVASLPDDQLAELLELADTHHVTVRALRVLQQLAGQEQQERVQEWCSAAIENEEARIGKAVEWLYAIVDALQMSGCPASVIKS